MAPQPVDVASLRREARALIASAWEQHGWPGHPRTAAAYQLLRLRMAGYLEIVYPQYNQQERHTIVERTLEQFMAPLYVPRRRARPRPSAALISALDDIAMSPDERSHSRGVGDKDEPVAQLAFGASPTRVRDGLAELLDEEKPAEFQIVTQYLDLVEQDQTRPPSSAEVIARINQPHLTMHRVKHTLLDFRRRVTDHVDAHT